MSCKTFAAGLQPATLIGLTGGRGTRGLSREAAHSEKGWFARHSQG